MSKRRNALQRGKSFEEWTARKFAEFWPTVRRRKKETQGYAVNASDLEDHDTPFVVECKKREAFPATLEKALDQAVSYDSFRVPVVVLGNTMRGGRQEARVYLDLDDFLALVTEER